MDRARSTGTDQAGRARAGEGDSDGRCLEGEFSNFLLLHFPLWKGKVQLTEEMNHLLVHATIDIPADRHSRLSQRIRRPYLSWNRSA
jgi:hypothetical protein